MLAASPLAVANSLLALFLLDGVDDVRAQYMFSFAASVALVIAEGKGLVWSKGATDARASGSTLRQ